MPFEVVAAELYGLDPDGFVAARTAAVAEAKRAGDRQLAARLAALKRPTRSAWLVNLLIGQDGSVQGRLAELAASLAQAHLDGAFDALRELGRQRNVLLAELTRAALALGEARSYSGGEAARAEVSATLAAALADRDALDAVAGGRLVKPLSYAGFGPLLAGPTLSVVAEPTPDPTPATPVDPDRLAEREREIARLEREVERSATALQASVEREQEARSSLDRASQEVADLRVELSQAEAAEAMARRAATVAADEAGRARAAEQDARRALTEARLEARSPR